MTDLQGSALLYGPVGSRLPRVPVGRLLLVDPERCFVGFSDKTASLSNLGVFKEESKVATGRVAALRAVAEAQGVPVTTEALAAVVLRGPGWNCYRAEEHRMSPVWTIMRTLREALAEKLVVNAIVEVDKGRWRWARDEDLRLHACVYTPTGEWIIEERR